MQTKRLCGSKKASLLDCYSMGSPPLATPAPQGRELGASPAVDADDDGVRLQGPARSPFAEPTSAARRENSAEISTVARKRAFLNINVKVLHNVKESGHEGQLKFISSLL